MNWQNCKNRSERASIFSKEYELSLVSYLNFEVKSFLGRVLKSRKPWKTRQEMRLLNLGCGVNKIPGFVNADFFVFRGPKNIRPDWMVDLRYPLPCPDNYWDGVFSEHTIEHLYPRYVIKLLKEILRTLKSGGWLRISVPDLKKYVNYYCGKEAHRNFERWETGAEALRSVSQNYHHRGLWDATLLSKCMTQCGFLQVSQVSFKKGSDIRLLVDSEEREWESLYMEGRKPEYEE